jgi:hypothetical protein
VSVRRNGEKMYHSKFFTCLTLLLISALSFSHFACSVFCVSPAYAGDVQYVYDDLGCLSAVVDGTSGEAAIYQYDDDAVGNLLSIMRQPASTLSIFLGTSGRTRGPNSRHANFSMTCGRFYNLIRSHLQKIRRLRMKRRRIFLEALC